MIEQIFNDYNKILQIIENKYLEGIQCQRNNLEEVYRLFSDEESKDIYKSEILMLLLRNFLKGDMPSLYSGLMTEKKWANFLQFTAQQDIFNKICCPETSSAKEILNYCKTATFILEQYKYKNIVRIEDGDICIDAGGCLGDTSLYFMNNGASKSILFEIDKELINFINKTLEHYPYDIKIINSALSNINSKLYYIPKPSNIGAGYVLNELPRNLNPDQYYEVSAITLDDFCSQHEIKPDFIKMDIEGSELRALEGSKNILVNCRPKFAICIYHKWEHRWEIPLFLKSLLEDYNFYLKKSHPYFETVFFGIAKEKMPK